jgi:hypothetical protein
MSSENPSHDKQRLVVPFRTADRAHRLRESLPCDHEYFDILSSPLSEDAALSDDDWRQRRVDNILALLKANAELRALAVRLSETLAARGLRGGNGLDQAPRIASVRAGNVARS